eukprot:226218-Alexandrium_andersonii.AAC.1
MDRECRHAPCCALGAGTRGHNRVRDAVHLLAALADSSACAEAVGLFPSAPDLRPVNVLTSAAIPG